MIDKVGDKGSFYNNLNAFSSAGFVSLKQKEIIQEILEAGHATMHRAYKPERFDVVKLMDITESIIEIIYVNEKEIKRIASKIPKKEKNKG